MNIDEEKWVKTWKSLLDDTPNIREFLKEQKKDNPNNWRPWIFKLIKLFKNSRVWITSTLYNLNRKNLIKKIEGIKGKYEKVK